jgi:Leucine Rich repeat
MDEPPTLIPPRRRTLRFGLRSAFVFVALVACGVGWLGTRVYRCRQEEAAFARLSTSDDRRGISVLYWNPFKSAKNDITGEPGMQEAFFPGGPKWLTSLLGVDIFRTVVTFGCSPPGNTFTWEVDDAGRRTPKFEFKTGLTDADTASINKLHYLQLLRLEANGVTDKGLSQLNNLPYIEHLSLSNTAITDDGLATLSTFPHLRILELRGTNISDAAIDRIAKCRVLETLDVAMTNMTSDGVKSLQQKLPKCKIEY